MDKLVLKGSLYTGFFFTYLTFHQIQVKVAAIQKESQFQMRNVTEQCEIDPPTRIASNEFIASFQQIVDTYGVPSPKEVNPATFAIVSFPFLFGVMFGDIAHGFLLFLIAAFMCLKAESLKKSAISSMVPARYLLLMMGFFATYAGFMYNDFASLPIEFLQKSCYIEESDRAVKDCVYGFGVDHRWYRSANEITFVNSLKMKLSVIFGVSQMSLGICMKAFNAYYQKSTMDFVFEFIPQIIMMLSLFGYMNLLIIIKWLTDYQYIESLAPSIITTMINIPLKGGMIEGIPFFGEGSTNSQVSIFLLLVAVICAPIMLLPKPLILKS